MAVDFAWHRNIWSVIVSDLVAGAVCQSVSKLASNGWPMLIRADTYPVAHSRWGTRWQRAEETQHNGSKLFLTGIACALPERQN